MEHVLSTLVNGIVIFQFPEGLILVKSVELHKNKSLTKASECTIKPVLSRHSKIDKTKIFMTNGSLMKVQSIKLQNAILLTCIKR